MDANEILNSGAVGALESGLLLLGDCVEVMRRSPSHSVDFVLTDPPYITRYRSRNGKSVINDDNDRWLQPAFAQVYRILRPDSFCVSFYGWNKTDLFMSAWRNAGFRIAGHIVFRKQYASSVRPLHALPARASLSVGKGQSTAAGTARVRRNRLRLYRQPTTSNPEAHRGAFAAHRGFLQAVRHCP